MPIGLFNQYLPDIDQLACSDYSYSINRIIKYSIAFSIFRLSKNESLVCADATNFASVERKEYGNEQKKRRFNH